MFVPIHEALLIKYLTAGLIRFAEAQRVSILAVIGCLDVVRQQLLDHVRS